MYLYTPEMFGLKTHMVLNDGKFFVYATCHDNPSGTSTIFDGNNGSYYCFACNTRKSFSQLCRETGLKPKKAPFNGRAQSVDTNFWKELLLNPVATGNAYLHNRGLTDETIEKFKIRASNNDVIIPVGYDDVFTGVIIRNTGKGVRYFKLGGIPPIIGAEQYQESSDVILMENTFGYLLGKQFGVSAILSPSTNITNSAKPIIKRFQNLTVWGNRDMSGYRFIVKCYLENPNIKILVGEPDEIKDKELFIKAISKRENISWFINYIGEETFITLLREQIK